MSAPSFQSPPPAPKMIYQPAPPSRPKQTPVVPLIGLLLAIVAMVIALLTAGDIVTGLGRAGLVALVTAGICIIGLIVAMVRRGSWLGATPIGFLIPAVLFGGIGAAGVFLEAPLHTVQGDSYKKEGKYLDAIAAYRRGDKANYTTSIPESYLLLGDQMVKGKNYQAAVDSYRLVSSEEYLPNRFSDTARQQLATTYLNWGLQLENDSSKAEEALAKYDAVIKAGGNTQAVDKAKLQARTLVLRVGSAQVQNGEYEKAIANYEKARASYDASDLELKASLSKTYLAWGNKLVAAGDYETAIAKLEPALKIYPEGPEITAYGSLIADSYGGIGRKLLEQKKYDEAVTKLGPAQTSYGKYDTKGQIKSVLAEGYTGLGGNFEGAKDLPKAIENYEKAQTYTGGNPNLKNDLDARLVRVYVGQGDIFAGAKNYTEAVNSYTKAIPYTVSNANAKNDVNARLFTTFVTWGEQYSAANDVPKTIESYEKSLAYVGNGDPRNNIVGRIVTLYLSQGESFFAQNQFEKAIEAWQKGLKSYPNPATNGQFRANVAKALYTWADQDEKAGNFQPALDRYRQILRDYGEFPSYTQPSSDAQPRVLFNWGRSLVTAGQYQPAIARYQELVDKFGGSDFAKQARDALGASQTVKVTVVRDGKPVANLKVKLHENWTFPAAGGFDTTGRELDFTTDANGTFSVTLAPNKGWLLAILKGDGYVTVTRGSGSSTTATNVITAVPLRGTSFQANVL